MPPLVLEAEPLTLPLPPPERRGLEASASYPLSPQRRCLPPTDDPPSYCGLFSPLLQSFDPIDSLSLLHAGIVEDLGYDGGVLGP